MQSLWEFSQTPSGTVVFIFASVAWLTLVATWPELKGWWKSSSLREKPLDISGHSLGGLVIHYAGYGLEFGKYRNVTERVRGFIDNDRVHIRVDEKSLQCDPYPGIPKRLLVIYSHGTNEGLKVEASDGQLIQFP